MTKLMLIYVLIVISTMAIPITLIAITFLEAVKEDRDKENKGWKII